jgi:hypothetical protein
MAMRLPVVAKTWIWILLALAAGAATGVASAGKTLPAEERPALSTMP